MKYITRNDHTFPVSKTSTVLALSLAVVPLSLCYYYGPPPSTLLFSYYLPTLPTPPYKLAPIQKKVLHIPPYYMKYQHF